MWPDIEACGGNSCENSRQKDGVPIFPGRHRARISAPKIPVFLIFLSGFNANNHSGVVQLVAHGPLEPRILVRVQAPEPIAVRQQFAQL